MKILIGTNNKNKLGQFERIFKSLDDTLELFSLADLNITDDVEEDSEDLLENASKKARYYGEKSGLPTLADDTGLFIDALDGEPGTHSKRWLSGSDRDRYLKVLERMEGVPREKRTCRYRGALAFYSPGKDLWTYQQDLEGVISPVFKEGKGFGYDPIVLVNNKYYSDYTEEEKAQISHRGMGARELLKHLTN
ncbi:MAG: non-canonical purine NTP pyrophosphatase [Candidatus Paceibacterota bacterium]|jgi:XTP/dITP diphosphohydrolase